MELRKVFTQRQEFRAEATTSLDHETEGEQPKATGKSSVVYPVSIQEHQIIDIPRAPTEMLDLKSLGSSSFICYAFTFCESVVEFMGHSEHWSIPQDCRLVMAVLEAGPRLQWRTWWRDATRAIDQQGGDRGYELFQDQILGEDHYADVERQVIFAYHTLAFFCITALNTWDKIEESGNRTEPFTKIIQDPKEAFIDFFFNN